MSGNVGRIVAGVVAAVAVLVVLVSAGSLIEILDAGHIMVIQFPRGQIAAYTEPGPYFQWWGTVTKYKKQDELDFRFADKREDDASLRIRFNDNGHAAIGGAILWEMPVAPDKIIALHTRYRSHAAIEQQLIRGIVSKTIYMTGPTMSSTESAAARRNELLNLIDDQIKNGVYKTEVVEARAKDVLTGAEKTIQTVKILRNEKGVALRQDDSPLDEFGIRTYNLVISHIVYDKDVEAQISQQQKAIMQVQIAMAKAKEAEQEAITVGKKGEADAAKAKWEQEVHKAREVTAAQQRKSVAELDAQTAELNKRKSILEGEGEAAKKRLIMEADGALQPKIDATLAVHKVWADAFAKYQGKLVPDVVMGSNSSAGSVANSGLNQMMEVVAAKAAKDLAIELRASGAEKTQGRK